MPPDTDYYTTVPLRIIKDVEALMKSRKDISPDGMVESKADFEALTKIYIVWKNYFPEDYINFIKSADRIRRDIVSAGTKGIARSGSAAFQHQLEIPEKLHQLMVIMFPNLRYTKEFVKQFVEYLPEFKVTDARI